MWKEQNATNLAKMCTSDFYHTLSVLRPLQSALCLRLCIIA